MLYRIELAQTITERATIYIEANNEAQAEFLALQQAVESGKVEWRFLDVESDPEIIACNPLEHA